MRKYFFDSHEIQPGAVGELNKKLIDKNLESQGLESR